MRLRTPSPAAGRNILLGLGGGLLALASIAAPSVLGSLRTFDGLGAMVFIAGMSMCGATGLRRLADFILRGPAYPWYARPGAFVFLPLAMGIVNPLAAIVCGLAFRLLGLEPAVPDHGLALEFTGLELLWIAVLDWPGPAGRTGRPSQEPSFREFEKDA